MMMVMMALEMEEEMRSKVSEELWANHLSTESKYNTKPHPACPSYHRRSTCSTNQDAFPDIPD
jgi:hypothetical protein